MEHNKYIVLFTDRNVLSPTGEWRLIASRAEALCHYFGIATRMVVLRPAARCAHSEAEHAANGLSVAARPYRSLLGLRRAVHETLAACDAACVGVMVSGLLVNMAVGAAARHGYPTLVDMHGDVAEWKEHAPPVLGPQQIGRSLYGPVNALMRRTARRADGCVVVSQPLAEVAARYGAKHTFVVPCCTVQTAPSRQTLRAHYRQAWNIGNDEQVWIYCGGLSAWQALPETIELFRRVARLDRNVRFVLATPEPAQIQRRMQAAGIDPQRYRSLRVTSNEVIGALCAADVGVMLRHRSLTNASAFPNKFSEYVAAGLFSIVGSGATDPAALTKQYDVGCVVETETIAQVQDDTLLRIMAAAACEPAQRHQRCDRLLERISMANTLRPLAHFLQHYPHAA